MLHSLTSSVLRTKLQSYTCRRSCRNHRRSGTTTDSSNYCCKSAHPSNSWRRGPAVAPRLAAAVIQPLLRHTCTPAVSAPPRGMAATAARHLVPPPCPLTWWPRPVSPFPYHPAVCGFSVKGLGLAAMAPLSPPFPPPRRRREAILRRKVHRRK
jgi:hypothetical protein